MIEAFNKVIDVMYQEKQKVKENLTNNLAIDERYSITFNEYTSLKNRRYLQINVYSVNGDITSLGLVRVLGRQDSESLKEIVRNRLQKFGIP